MRLTSESGEEFELEELPNQDHKPITQRVYGLVPTPIKKDWPQKGDENWYTSAIGTAERDGHFEESERGFGNYWRTKEEAEAVAKIYKEVNRVVKIGNQGIIPTELVAVVDAIREAQNIVKESK